MRPRMKEDEITETYGMFYVGVVKADGRERARIVELETRCAALETKCAELQTDLDKCNEDARGLVHEVEGLRGEQQKLKGELSYSQAYNEDLKVENQTLRDALLEGLEDTRDGEGSDSG